MEYHVTVVDKFNRGAKNFIIYISSITNNNSKSNIKKQFAESDSNLCYQIALQEYEHCVKRLQRLDNKIYILLTVCAFLFTRITNAIGLINEISFPVNIMDWLFLCLYLFLLLYCSISIIQLLYSLIKALSSIKMDRFDSSEILEKNMVFADKRKVIEYVIIKYEQARDKSNTLIDKRYIKIDYCVKTLKNLVVALVIMTMIGSFLSHVKSDELCVTEGFKQCIVSMVQNYIKDNTSIVNSMNN